MLRKANDEYRKIIFNAQMYANTGATTYEKAVDMAAKDFLARGITCVEYSNGSKHTLRDYSDMAIRTANKRAKLVGEGEKRAEWGISTVIMNKRGNPCPKCLPFCGKVLIDDVWSGGSKDGVDSETRKTYPLMSYAIECGLYHPRCKDGHTTYFPGISEEPKSKYSQSEIEEIKEDYVLEQKKRIAKNNYEKYAVLEKNSLDEENKAKYRRQKEEWHLRYKTYYTDDANCTDYKTKHSSRKDREQFERYTKVLKELSPKTIEEFINIKYNEAETYKSLKRKYRLLNQYKIDSGEFSASEILKMDWDIIHDKRNKFNSKTKKSGNIAGAKIDGEDKYYIAHSKISDAASKAYKGSNILIGEKTEFRYKYIDVETSDGTLRKDTFHDTEAKLFEYFADMYEKKPFKRIDMLSERGMCDSCKGVMEQFKKEHPEVIINVVSNKRVEGDVWKYRLRNKK